MARHKTPALRRPIRGTIDNQDQQNRLKIRKTEPIVDGKLDRLSTLPDDLLVKILSFLDMEEAVQTGILSKRWNNLWTRVDTIVYKRPFNKHNEESLQYLQRLSAMKTNDHLWFAFIHTTLRQCTSKIKTFSLSGFVRSFCVFGFEEWIAYVVKNKVENLKLDIIFPAPDCVFQSSTITKLELLTMKVDVSATVNLSGLKSLLLERVYTSDDFLENLLLGTPVLENLVLRGCIGVSRLNIISPSVKMLELWDLNDDEKVFTIKAPWLKKLKISGNFTFANCEFVGVSSLLEATLTFHNHLHKRNLDLHDYVTKYNDSWIPMVTKLLKSLSYAGELIIGSELIQVLLLLKFSGTPFKTLFMCKKLTIETCLWKFVFPGIACILEITPHLKSLLIKVVPFSMDPKDGYLFYQKENFFQDENQYLNKPSGKFLHLKNFKVEYLQMPCHYNIEDNQGRHFESDLVDFESHLVEYFLKGAVVLQKFAVCSPRRGKCSDSSCIAQNCSYHYVSSFVAS